MAISRYETKAGQARYMVEWRLPDRTKRRKSFRTRREAREFEAMIKIDAGQGIFHDPKRDRTITLAVLWERWRRSRIDLAPKTRTGYEAEWRLRIEPRLGGLAVAQLNRPVLQNWVNDLVADGTSPRMVRWAATVVRQVLALAVEDTLMARNPAENLRLPALQTRQHIYLTPRQVDALAAACGDQGDVVTILCYTGLRWGELAALDVQDVDLERRRLVVSKTTSHGPGGRLTVGPPKTKAGRRTVPIPGRIAALLAARIEGRPRDAPAVAAPGGGRLRRENWVRDVSWRRAIKTINEDSLRIHDLRHTFATLARAAGADIYLISRTLGHASIGVTASTYADLFDSELTNVADRLDEIDNLPIFSNESETKSSKLGPLFAHCGGQMSIDDELDGAV